MRTNTVKKLASKVFDKTVAGASKAKTVAEGYLNKGAARVAAISEDAANLGYKAGTAGGDLTPEVYDDTLRQAVRLNLVLTGEIAHGKSAADVSAGPFRYQSGSGLSESGDAADAVIVVGLGKSGAVPAVELVAVAPVAKS